MPQNVHDILMLLVSMGFSIDIITIDSFQIEGAMAISTRHYTNRKGTLVFNSGLEGTYDQFLS